jgi:hypothetical protein
MIWFRCPWCGTDYFAQETQIGQWVACRESAARFRVPPGSPYEEEHWLRETRVGWLVACAGKISPRKLRLFACACCWRLEPLWSEGPDSEPYRHALEVSEAYANGETSLGQLSQVASALGNPRPWWEVRTPILAARWAILHLTRYKPDLGEMLAVFHNALPEGQRQQEGQRQCEIARDVFGNPFRPVTFDPAWLRAQEAVGKVARAVYVGRAFEDLPILGDALEEAGCTDEQLLNHCRAGGTHVRGCWTLDLLLTRE